MSPALDSSQKYILGLDLGSASIGWATIRLNDQLEPTEVFDAGVRIFDPGVEVTAKISTEEAIIRGIDRSKAVGRRLARQRAGRAAESVLGRTRFSNCFKPITGCLLMKNFKMSRSLPRNTLPSTGWTRN